MHKWLLAHRPEISDGSAGAKAMDYTLKRWDVVDVNYPDRWATIMLAGGDRE